jgi:hypothetical protein
MTDANSEVVWANPSEVAAWAEDMPWEYLECRKRGNHHMDYYRAYYDKDIKAYREILRCKCCKAVTRENIICPDTGDYLERGPMRYQEGYLRPPGTGRMDNRSRGVVRLMVIQHRAEKAPRRLRRVS